MSSIFNQDWNNDGEFDEVDSAIDMMLIEDMENEPNTSHCSSTDKSNGFLKVLLIIIIGFILICSPIMTLLCPIVMGFETIKEEIPLEYSMFAIITIIEIVCCIKKLIRYFQDKYHSVEQEKVNNEEIEVLITKTPSCLTKCGKCGYEFKLNTANLFAKENNFSINCPHCSASLDYSHIDVRQFKHDMKCLGFISSKIK